MPQRTILPWTTITRAFICISMFSFDIDIRIHSVRVSHAKCPIGRKFDDAVVQSDLHFLSRSSARQTNPNFVWNIEERKKNLYVVSFFSSFPLINFFYFKSPEEISSIVLLKMKETTDAYLGTTVSIAVVTVHAYISTTLSRPRRTLEPSRDWTFTESSAEPTTAVTSSSSILAEELSMYPFWLLGRGFSK